jgi:hypothetical protein
LEFSTRLRPFFPPSLLGMMKLCSAAADEKHPSLSPLHLRSHEYTYSVFPFPPPFLSTHAQTPTAEWRVLFFFHSLSLVNTIDPPLSPPRYRQRFPLRHLLILISYNSVHKQCIGWPSRACLLPFMGSPAAAT